MKDGPLIVLGSKKCAVKLIFGLLSKTNKHQNLALADLVVWITKKSTEKVWACVRKLLCRCMYVCSSIYENIGLNKNFVSQFFILNKDDQILANITRIVIGIVISSVAQQLLTRV